MEKTLNNPFINILITGYRGFVGQNLINKLSKSCFDYQLFLFDRSNTEAELEEMCAKCNIVFHLGGVVRPNNPLDYNDNTSLTERLLHFLVEKNNTCPIVFSSSIQAELDNPYGNCKRIEEKQIIQYGCKNNVKTYVYRFPNLFGKYSKPNYTSVIATFCYNISHGLPIIVDDPARTIQFAYIEDVLDSIFQEIFTCSNSVFQSEINTKYTYAVTLGELAYYMGTMKGKSKPMIYRNDSFYENLLGVYQWFSKDYEKWENRC